MYFICLLCVCVKLKETTSTPGAVFYLGRRLNRRQEEEEDKVSIVQEGMYVCILGRADDKSIS